MAGQAIKHLLRFLVGLVTVPTGILHRRIGRQANPVIRESLVTVNTVVLTLRDKLLPHYQELMAVKAMHICHWTYYAFVLMTNVTDGPRRAEAVYGNSVARGAGDVLLICMHLVTSSSSYLNPLGTTALVTLATNLILD